MDTTASSFTARNNAKRAAEKMIANGKAPAVDYSIRPRDDGRFEIVWKTVPTTGEVETEIATAATAAEDGHYSTDEIDKPFSAGSLAQVGTSRALERARQPFCPSKARWPRGLLGCGFVNADSRRRRWPQASVYKAASQQRQSAVALGGLPCSKATAAGIAQCPVRDAFGMRCGIVILHGRPRGEEQGWRMKALPRSL